FAYGLATILLACPWFIAVALRDRSFLSYFFWTHHVVRYVAPLDHEQPFWYYAPGLILGMFPWTLFFPGVVLDWWKRLKHRGNVGPADLFLLAFLWCVVFHSASGCKRSGYILPALPPFALLLGCQIERWLAAGVDMHFRLW